MSQYDAAATPMWRCFTSEANNKPFTSLPSNVDLNDINIAMNEWQRKSEEFDFTMEDRAPDQAFNEVLWVAVKGEDIPFPAINRAAFVRVKEITKLNNAIFILSSDPMRLDVLFRVTYEYTHGVPMYPNSFWSFKHALKFVSKKASFPPLGLLTVASLLPQEWNKKLVDLNTKNLNDDDIRWADYVLISAMSIQSASANEVIERCKQLQSKIVVGGPLFTSSSEQYDHVDHLVLNEAEITLPQFLHDLNKGTPKHKYTTEQWVDVTTTPLPSWNLVEKNNYSSMNIQYSRGCPYDCDFCDITVLYGRNPRTKTKEQVLSELMCCMIPAGAVHYFLLMIILLGTRTN